MVASLMALNALAIDIMLPALGTIADDLGVASANDRQLVVVAYVLGFGLPQLVWGPLSDRFGRRPVLLCSLVGYTFMGLLAAGVSTFEQLLAARMAQGVFAAGARVVAVAVVRDIHSGREMASIMSWVMTVFMAVPIIAPMLGQLVLYLAPWRWLFALLGAAGLLMMLWTGLRLDETGEPQTGPLLRSAMQGYLALLRSRVTVGYTLAGGVIFASLFAYLAAAEQIFAEVFDAADTFVFWFALIAAALAAANIANARLVRRFGMRRLSHGALLGFTLLSALLLALSAQFGESLALFIPLFSALFALFGLIGSNFNALAMEPFRETAGTASAAYGFITTTASGVIGGWLARGYDGSSLPLIAGYVALGLTGLTIVAITERGKLFGNQ